VSVTKKCKIYIFIFGGDVGNRTPVQKQITLSVYTLSLLIILLFQAQQTKP